MGRHLALLTVAVLLQTAECGLYDAAKDKAIIQYLDGDNFDRIVYNHGDSSTNVWRVIEFYASWCGHCQNYAKTYRQIAATVAGAEGLQVGAVDCGDKINGDVCREQGVKSYPTLKLFPKTVQKNGQSDGEKPSKISNRSKKGIIALVASSMGVTADSLTHRGTAGGAAVDAAGVLPPRAAAAGAGAPRSMGSVSIAETKVHHRDIQSAVLQSLWSEIGGRQSLEGNASLVALHWVAVLSRFAKVSPGFDQSLGRLHLLLKAAHAKATVGSGGGGGSGVVVTAEEWAGMLVRAELPSQPAGDVAWAQCKGTTPSLRGYPCGLWSVFHALVAKAAGHSASAESETLAVIEEYVTTFFGCEYCVDHFKQEIASKEWWYGEGDSRNRTRGASVLALWRLHNKVNVRLSANVDDASTDPAHPKQSFPLWTQCKDCKIAGVWDETALLRFLVAFYTPSPTTTV